MHDTHPKRHPAQLPVLRASNAYHYTGAKRDLHKNLPTNIRTHRQYISSHSLFEWATWSTKFACGFAPPVAFVDPCLTKSLATRPSDFNLAHVPYILWFSVNAHTDSRLTNSHPPGSFQCAPHTHPRQLNRVLDRLQGCSLRQVKGLTMWQGIRISQRQQARLQRLESAITQ